MTVVLVDSADSSGSSTASGSSMFEDINGSCHSSTNLSILEGEDSGRIVDVSLETIHETTSTSDPDPSTLSRFYPRWRGKPVYHGNAEALGWALDSIGRAVYVIGMGAFLGTALLQLAKEAAGCVPDQVCDKTVYGMRPSSLLTTYTMTVGIVSASLLPLMGSIVDYTPHRRAIGKWMSAIFCALIVPQIFVSEHTWLAVTAVLVVSAFVGWAQTLVTYAYLPELTDCEERLTGYTQSFTIVNFGSMVIYLAMIVGISSLAGFGDDTILTARFALIVALVVSSVTLYVSWFKLLKKRPPARQLPPDRCIWTMGFVQLYHTCLHIYREYPALKWFYVSISMVDAAINALGSILLTYLTDTLQFGARENGITILLMLVGSIPGALATGPMIRFFNPIRTSVVGTAILLVNTVVLSFVLKEQSQKLEAFTFAFVWGFGTGWKWTTDRLMASTLIPEGQDTELMGVYLFSGQIFTWLPPLIFTTMNEAGVNQRISICVQASFFLLGILALLCMGGYEDAVKHAGRMRTTNASAEEKARVDDETRTSGDTLELELGDDTSTFDEVEKKKKSRTNTEETVVAESIVDERI